MKTVEIYTVEGDSWRQGTELPHEIGGFAKALPFEDTFIIAGGYNKKEMIKVII